MLKYSIEKELENRILILDGGLGTMVQGYSPDEETYRGEEFAAWKVPLKGCNDLLVLTSPHIIQRIHEAYLLAGADIISTCSFNANAVSLADYGLQQYVYRINRTAAALARFEADRLTLENPSKPRFVAGSIGPTGRSASIPVDVNHPESRSVDFDTLVAAYCEQVRGLVDGGADLLLVETVFDTLNAKAAVFAIDEVARERGIRLPLMISGTLTETGRTLSGQTIEAFYNSLSHAGLLSIGLNCGFGAGQLHPYLKRLSATALCRVSVHPNAGLPNAMGGYDESPSKMAADVEQYMKEGLVNIVGGCCGTTPAHIGAIAAVARRYSPRPLPDSRKGTVVSGLEPLEITPGINFVNVGERTNVAGSARFARLVREGRWDESLSVAAQQVEAGAQVVDVCMDDPMIEAVGSMKRFLNLVATEPDISRVPLMIDSSRWEVLEAGLKCVQGRSIVNSISLKEGEEEFLRRADLIRRYGAAMVVMLFDEEGQADTLERKTAVARRCYDLLTGSGIAPEDIIFDPNVLAVATGIEGHNRYGIDFIEACRWIRSNLPGANTSGGISNLSFSFRGNNTVREALHSVFLYHAIQAGLDMGIVNASTLRVYSDIEPQLLELATDVVLCRRDDATDRLISYAADMAGNESGPGVKDDTASWRDFSLEERIAHAMTKGVTTHIADDALEAYRAAGSPLAVIDGYLMPAMEHIGEMFAEGKMFLPQVIKSARVMKGAVEALTPYMQDGEGEGGGAGKILIATVKGDVHDIGKNIASVVMACNGYRIRDLGVMIDSTVIAREAADWGADAVGLSGLITPSLEEMIRTVEEMGGLGLTVPVIIGGATTSDMHTAVKIAPRYKGVVIRSRDAADNVRILSALTGAGRDAFIASVRESQERLRSRFESNARAKCLIPPEEARHKRHVKDDKEVILPRQTGRIVFRNYPVREVEQYIDWNFFFPAMGLRGNYPAILSSPEKGEEARRLFVDAQKLLRKIEHEGSLQLSAVVGIFPARCDGDDIVVTDGSGREVTMAQLRNCEAGNKENLSLADYVAGGDTPHDFVGAFVVSAGAGLDALTSRLRDMGDDYNAILAKLLADRLTEALAERVHLFVREEMWGYQHGSGTPADVLKGRYQGIRVAFGYPACPDHSLKREVFDLLGAHDTIGVSLTENYMISPGETLCGLIFADPEARYFSVGKISAEQLSDYAARRALPEEEIRKMIAQHLE